MFGVDPSGKPIVPKYDSMFDDPRNHPIYMDQRALGWLRSWPDVDPVLVPVVERMIDADIYDGLGTFLPFGVFLNERIAKYGFNFWMMHTVFDCFSVDQLESQDKQIVTVKQMFNLHRYADSAKAFRDYLSDRRQNGQVQPLTTLEGATTDDVVPDAWKPRFGGGDEEFDII